MIQDQLQSRHSRVAGRATTDAPIQVRPQGSVPYAFAVGVLALGALQGCASVRFDRETATSGTFRSSARSFTIFSFEYPRSAIVAAHENVSDSGLPQLRVTSETSTNWGWWDWVLEILSIRSASVRGTWGDPGE